MHNVCTECRLDLPISHAKLHLALFFPSSSEMVSKGLPLARAHPVPLPAMFAVELPQNEL